MKSTRDQIKHLRAKIAHHNGRIAVAQAEIDSLTHQEARRSAELAEERLQKRNAQFVAAKFGIEIDDELKEHDRISVWPPESLKVDPYDGDHYIYSWTEAAKRVSQYASCLPELRRTVS